MCSVKAYTLILEAFRVLCGIGEDDGETLNEALEENAFVLNLDYARAKLVFLDKKAGVVADSNSFIKQFASENDVDDIQEGIPVSLLPELIDYISENSEMIESDISAVLDTNKSNYESDAEFFDKQQESLDDDDEFVDDVETEEVQPVKTEKASEESATVEELNKEIDEKIENENRPIDAKNEEKEIKSFATFDKVKKDPLLEKAITLFDTQHYVTLPGFDELTHKELQEQLIESHFTVKKARDEGIRKIYHRMKEETAESAQAIKEQVLQKAKKVMKNN